MFNLFNSFCYVCMCNELKCDCLPTDNPWLPNKHNWFLSIIVNDQTIVYKLTPRTINLHTCISKRNKLKYHCDIYDMFSCFESHFFSLVRLRFLSLWQKLRMFWTCSNGDDDGDDNIHLELFLASVKYLYKMLSII